MAQVFLSFIHEEQDWADQVHRFVGWVLPGVGSFLSSDRNAILAGEDWMERIFKELEQSKVLLSLLSPQSVSRPWINFEAGAAWMAKAKVIPVCFGGLSIASLPKPYSSLQAVDLETYEGSFYLVNSIARHLNLALPEEPQFPNKRAPLKVMMRTPEDNRRVLSPYNNLQSWVREFKGVTRQP
jgi:hypothetical protein